MAESVAVEGPWDRGVSGRRVGRYSRGMHPLIAQYRDAVAAPQVSAEAQLETLRTRDRLARLEEGLSADERVALAEADVALVRAARTVVARLEGLAPLSRLRPEGVEPRRWWWWLDVVAHTPLAAVESGRAPARPPRGRRASGPGEVRPSPRYFSIERSFHVGATGERRPRRWRIRDARSRSPGAPGAPRRG